MRTELTNGMNGDITVYLADGKYFIPETLHFNPDDSGNNGLKVTYKAGKGANPEISGGIEITGWVQEQSGLWVANIPDELVGTSFRELFVNGKRFTRARHPNDSYLRVAEVDADRRTNFCFLEGDFPNPHSQQQVELVLLHDWAITRIPIAMIDYNLNRITAVDSIGAKGLNFFNLDNWEKNPRYFLENDIAFLDAPGEWFFDTSEKLLYLKLPDGLEPGELNVTIPVTGPHLVVLEGTEFESVNNISFEGISFSHCAWMIPEKGYAGIQACHFDPLPSYEGWAVVPAAIYAQ